MSEDVADALLSVFTSPNELDSNGEQANIVDVTAKLSRSARAIATAITPTCVTGTDASGGQVGSLTEAVMGVTAGLHAIAEAINRLADSRN